MNISSRILIESGQATSAGIKAINQDSLTYHVPSDNMLLTKGAAFVMADGISSSKVSDIASQTAVCSFIEDYYSTPETWSVKQSGQKVLQAINSWLYAQTCYHRYAQDQGYVCTMAALICKANTAHLFHSGDTRIYRLSQSNPGNDSAYLQQLTDDHRTLLSSQENYLNNALGIRESLELDYKEITIRQGDYFVIATDGIYEFIDEQALVSLITESTENDIIKLKNEAPNQDNYSHHLDTISRCLIDFALKNGSNDNLSVQVIYIKQLPTKEFDELQDDLKQLPFLESIQPNMQVDEFRILKELYISGRSHVYLGEQIQTQQKVALKFPAQSMQHNLAYLESMLMEEWIAKRVNSPHIIKPFNLSTPKSYFYTTTEYFPAQSLHQWIIDHILSTKSASEQENKLHKVRDILAQIAKGLQALHRKEIIHQDLRPENILIDAHGVVKIIDLGSAKVAGLSEISPHNHDMLGTLAFSAPEYLMQHISSHQTDIFSLGVIAYHMLSGQLPYGSQLGQNYKQNRLGKLRYQSLLITQDIPYWVDCAIQKASHLNPQKRYLEASEFIHDLNHPNPTFIPLHQRPLLTQNPLLFWQCSSAILFCLVLFLLHKLSA